MNKISCDVIRDILPLYADGVASEDTRRLVEEHLEQCGECRGEYERMKKTVVVPVEGDAGPLRRFKSAWRRKKLVLVCLTALVTAAVIFGAVSADGQLRRQALRYSREYVPGDPGIRGSVDVWEYTDIHPDFDIGANSYGLPVFKDPERALETMKDLYAADLARIRTEFDLEELTTGTCRLYKVCAAQAACGTREEQERARFVAGFLDIYENSFFGQ